MQHYGAPTRLLDWTDNPLVALFFAVDRFEKEQCEADSKEQEDAAVWVLDPKWLNRHLKKGITGPMLHTWDDADSYLGDPFEHTIRVQKPAAMDPPHVDPRLSIQASHFVIFGLTKDLTKMTAVRKRASRLAKIPIAKESLDAIQDELEICGTTWGALFPDLEGLCKGIRKRWRKK